MTDFNPSAQLFTPEAEDATFADIQYPIPILDQHFRSIKSRRSVILTMPSSEFVPEMPIAPISSLGPNPTAAPIIFSPPIELQEGHYNSPANTDLFGFKQLEKRQFERWHHPASSPENSPSQPAFQSAAYSLQTSLRQIERWSYLAKRVKGKDGSCSSMHHTCMHPDYVNSVQYSSLKFAPWSSQVKKALRKGVPNDIRGHVWFFYSGAQELASQNPHLYPKLCSRIHNPDYSELLLPISKSLAFDPGYEYVADLPSYFTMNQTFLNLEIKSARDPILFIRVNQAIQQILLAYALYRSDTFSYNPSICAIVACLLMITRDEEQSFWILDRILSHHLPSNFYQDNLIGCNIEQEVLLGLLRWKLPQIYQKLVNEMMLDTGFAMLTAPWMQSLFIGHLPFEWTLRVLDAFLAEGPKVLLRISYALFHLNQKTIVSIENQFELAKYLRTMPQRIADGTKLLDIAFDTIGRLSTPWIIEERNKATPTWEARYAVRRFSVHPSGFP